MSWTPTNIDPRVKNIDNILGINGLSNLILQKVPNDTFCNFNVNSSLSGCIAPDGFSCYVLGFWFEVFDENVFLTLYNNNPSAEFIILSDMFPNEISLLKRCSWVRLVHWKWFIRSPISENSTQLKKYKISSLSNRVNEFKFFITAKLLDLPDVYLTWNANYLKNVSYDYIFSKAGCAARDELLIHIDRLKNTVNCEKFINDPEISLGLAKFHPAYTQSLVNFTNETKDVSWHADIGILPGPYITEKTWKPLLAGNALLFSGQYNTKHTLELAGFNFDYPWPDNYSLLSGDLDRLSELLSLVDDILEMSFEKIQKNIKESVDYNQNLIKTGQIAYYIDQINQAGIDLLTDIF